ncbi:MAG: cupin domain-containing protein [Pseudomonadota bacterium]
MSEKQGVILVEPHGPAETGLEEWETIDPSGLVSGQPVQRGHLYHEIAATGYLTGVWDCTAMTGHMEPYPDDELMILLEGTLVMALPDGTEIDLKAGDAFIIPKGLTCQWKQPGYLRKIFMILSEPVEETASNPSLQRITVPDMTAGGLSDGAIESTDIQFINSTSHMVVSTRTLMETSKPLHPASRNDLTHVLSGAVTMEVNGETKRFGAGETFYVYKGTPITWQTEAGTRLLQTSYLGG